MKTVEPAPMNAIFGLSSHVNSLRLMSAQAAISKAARTSRWV